MKRLLLALVLIMIAFPALAVDKGKESAYDRVMRTGTIRCGYILYDPVVKKDPNSGELSGILFDIMNHMAARLELKIEWTEEVPFVTAFEGLKTNRYDAVCAPLWGWPPQARMGELIGPMYYYPIGAWARADDTRFDSGLSSVNNEGIKISGVDGTFPLDAAKADFPKAHSLSLPQMSDYTQPLMEVKTGKADITFMDNNIGLRFLNSNPGTVKNIAANPPYKIFGQFIMIDKNEHSLRTMLQSVVNLMILDGSMDRLIVPHENRTGAYYRVAKPYEVPK